MKLCWSILEHYVIGKIIGGNISKHQFRIQHIVQSLTIERKPDYRERNIKCVKEDCKMLENILDIKLKKKINYISLNFIN